MKIYLLIFSSLIVLSLYVAFMMLSTYAQMMSIIVDPIACPITHCPVCVEYTKKECEPFSWQSCEYEILCPELYCEACPKTYEEEFENCRALLKLEEEN